MQTITQLYMYFSRLQYLTYTFCVLHLLLYMYTSARTDELYIPVDEYMHHNITRSFAAVGWYPK